jgi:tyrosyl-tRNA synthetase
MQGYDSVEIKADVEIGATEQTFNLLAARSIQRDYGLEPQVALTFPVLPGLDGVRRMSKSLGNYVGVCDAPEEMYGKMMSIPDDAVPVFVRMVSGWDAERQVEAAAGCASDPMGWKARLAFRVVEIYHGGDGATAAADHFDRVIRRKERPEEMEEAEIAPWGDSLWVPRLLKEAGLASSTSEARRLIEGGGVTVDDARVDDPKAEIAAEPGRVYVLKVGKRKYLRVRIGSPG